MKVGSKLLYEELQTKFDFSHSLITLSGVIAPLLKIRFPDFVLQTFLHYSFTYQDESWWQGSV